jgi:hypothetical protein
MLLRVGDDHLLYPAMRTLYRIFNRGSFSYGGRFYGGWWQQIPKKFDRICSLMASPPSSTITPSCIPICFMRKLEHVSMAMHTRLTAGLATS